MVKYEVVCGSCNIEFSVKFPDEDDAEVKYCCSCGCEIIDELDFEK